MIMMINNAVCGCYCKTTESDVSEWDGKNKDSELEIISVGWQAVWVVPHQTGRSPMTVTGYGYRIL